jgi:branched-chain amino acid aminotransferase
MLTATDREGAWHEVAICGYGPLSLLPNISGLQYGISVFEGLKAHRTAEGEVALFRASQNAVRLNRSAARIAMPQLPEEIFIQWLRGCARWCDLTGNGCPHWTKGLYISVLPVFGRSFGAGKSKWDLSLVIFTFPFGSCFSAPVEVIVSEHYVRAFPGGTGEVKSAGNYAPTLLVERKAREAGFDTVLWLDGPSRTYVEECGVMNVFFVIDETIVTPAL